MTDTCPECRPLREALQQGQRDLVTVAQQLMHIDVPPQVIAEALRQVGMRLAEAAEG